MNFNNFNIDFSKSLVPQTFYATKAVQEISEAFETHRYKKGLPTASQVVQQVFQGLLPVTTGFAILTLKMIQKEHTKQLSKDLEKQQLINQVVHLKSELLKQEREGILNSQDLNSQDLIVSLTLKNACINSLSQQVASLLIALHSAQTADSSQATADSSQANAYKLLQQRYLLLQEQSQQTLEVMQTTLALLKSNA